MFARRNLLTGLLLALVACKGNQSSDAAKPAASEPAPEAKKDQAVRPIANQRTKMPVLRSPIGGAGTLMIVEKTAV